MATKTKAAKKKAPAKKAPATTEYKIKVNQKKLEEILKKIEYSTKPKAAAAALSNNSDLCKIWSQYGDAFRFVVTILPGVGTTMKKLKKALAIIADGIETNCTTDLEGVGEDEEEA